MRPENDRRDDAAWDEDIALREEHRQLHDQDFGGTPQGSLAETPPCASPGREGDHLAPEFGHPFVVFDSWGHAA